MLLQVVGQLLCGDGRHATQCELPLLHVANKFIFQITFPTFHLLRIVVVIVSVSVGVAVVETVVVNLFIFLLISLLALSFFAYSWLVCM